MGEGKSEVWQRLRLGSAGERFNGTLDPFGDRTGKANW